MADDWISTEDAAVLLDVSKSSVYRSLADEGRRSTEWGEEGVAWRYKPLSTRKIFQVSRRRVMELGGKSIND